MSIYNFLHGIFEFIHSNRDYVYIALVSTSLVLCFHLLLFSATFTRNNKQFILLLAAILFFDSLSVLLLALSISGSRLLVFVTDDIRIFISNFRFFQFIAATLTNIVILKLLHNKMNL